MECYKRQLRINELEDELSQAKAKLRYQERTAKEGPFKSSTPSSKIPIKLNTLSERQAKKGGGKLGHKGYGRSAMSPDQADRDEIVGDKRMADYAEKYARRRYRTDVFAFDLSDTGSELIGQIIVNSQLAREQARKLKTNPAAELALYITHGLLHLTHYDNHTKKNAQKMHH